jgi:hypothetical protein
MSTRATASVGLASFGLIVAAGVMQPLWLAPGTGASGREIAAYVADNRSTFLASIFLYTLGMAGFFAFGIALWTWLRRRPGVAQAPAAVFACGIASLCSVVFVGFAPALVLAYRSGAVGDPRLLWDLAFAILALSGAPTVLALGAYAWVVLSTGALAPWSGWIAAVAAAAHVVIVGTFFFSSGFFSLEGGVIVAIPTTMFLWLLAASVSLLRLPAEPLAA